MQTPKEKAIELVDKYYKLFSVDLENTISKYEAVHCAIIAVEEIISQWEYVQNLEEEGYFAPIEFWNEVLTELKAML